MPLLRENTEYVDLEKEVSMLKERWVRAMVSILAAFALCFGLPGAAFGAADTPADAPGEISVTFRLIGATLSEGDVNYSCGTDGGVTYVTWIATKAYTLGEGATVYDLFVKALADADLSAEGQENNYVKSITAPKVFGGYELSEFTNGAYSGWMYTIDGKHPGWGVRERVLEDGDAVVFHYVNDYRHEVEDWFDDLSYPALGDGSRWSKWLLAADENPGGTEWFRVYMDFAAEKGLFADAAPAGLDPNAPAGRAAFLTALYRLDGAPAAIGSAGFTDVQSDRWYADAVAWGVANGIVSGYGDGSFGPDDNVTREQVAVILYNYAKHKGYDTTKTADLKAFSDASAIGNKMLTAVKWANAEGLLNGRTATTLVPRGNVTYAETAAVLKRLAETVAEVTTQG
jgi:hypothetical protein